MYLAQGQRSHLMMNTKSLELLPGQKYSDRYDLAKMPKGFMLRLSKLRLGRSLGNLSISTGLPQCRLF